MAKKFLERHLDWENEIKMENHVIIGKKDYQAVEQALEFRRIKELDGVVYSNTNYEFEIDQCVNRKLDSSEKELSEEEKQLTLFQGKVIGRIQWKDRENDYIVLLDGTEDEVRQTPESLLQKCKSVKD